MECGQETRFRYPRIPHVTFSTLVDPDDYYSDEKIFGKEWIITEKIDGSQVSFEMDGDMVQSHNRNTLLLSGNTDRQFHPMPEWIGKHYENLRSILGQERRFYGEWMFHVHTVKYDRLPDWFIGFGIFDKNVCEFINFLKAIETMEKYGFSHVPILGRVILKNQKHLESFVKQSAFGHETAEGVVLHSPDGKIRIKYVTKSFKERVDASKHWRSCQRIRNSLM